MFFSIAKVAFINVAAWSDCVKVDAAVYEDIMAKVSAGTHTLGADEQGPIAVPVVATVLTAEQVLQIRLNNLNNEYETATGLLRSGYPLSESISWGDQVRESKELLAADPEGAQPETPFIDALFSARADGIDETKISLAERIVYLHGQITPPFAALTGKRHVAERALNEALTEANPVDAINAVTWNFSF